MRQASRYKPPYNNYNNTSEVEAQDQAFLEALVGALTQSPVEALATA